LKLAYPFMTALALMILPGCGSSISSLCEDGCDCQGCSDRELDDCIDTFEDAERAAEDEGCADQFDDLLACYDDEFSCIDGEVDLDGCGPEQESLGDCVN
jgi:hypothetical protein